LLSDLFKVPGDSSNWLGEATVYTLSVLLRGLPREPAFLLCPISGSGYSAYSQRRGLPKEGRQTNKIQTQCSARAGRSCSLIASAQQSTGVKI